MNRNTRCFQIALLVSIASVGEAEDNVVFADDFGDGLARWEVLDPATWRTHADGTVEITERESEYTPPHRSPKHIALVQDLFVADLTITFRVKSTLDTGSHRDCCVFFGWQDAAHFYYVHLGARPDPHSGQIMIVDGADRRAMTENQRPVPWDDGWHTVQLTPRRRERPHRRLLRRHDDAPHGDDRQDLRRRARRHRLVRRPQRVRRRAGDVAGR